MSYIDGMNKIHSILVNEQEGWTQEYQNGEVTLRYKDAFYITVPPIHNEVFGEIVYMLNGVIPLRDKYAEAARWRMKMIYRHRMVMNHAVMDDIMAKLDAL